MKVISLVGARPQFIKEAVINYVVRKDNAWTHILVHSGQHYDFDMSGTFFEELGIPSPDYYMGIGSSSHAVQTANAMVKFETILLRESPDLVMLYGDTNTTLAGAITAAKLHIPIAHVEAGPRTYSKLFPEEINRILTDHVSDLLFACTDLNVSNLAQEGIVNNVYNVGDVMYDLYTKMSYLFDSKTQIEKYGLCPGNYVVATIHRDFNIDVREVFESILSGITDISNKFGLKVVLPMHPRALKNFNNFNFKSLLNDKIIITEPMGYIELMSLSQRARFIITDSGGFQKESYWSKKRAILVMPQGWQEIIDTGWNKLVVDPISIDWINIASEVLEPMGYPNNIFGDGHAAEKIVGIIKERFK